MSSIIRLLTTFGAVPVNGKNMYKLLKQKENILLYPGGAREVCWNPTVAIESIELGDTLWNLVVFLTGNCEVLLEKSCITFSIGFVLGAQA